MAIRIFRLILLLILIVTAFPGCSAENSDKGKDAALNEHPWLHEAADGTISLWTVDYKQVMNMIVWALQNNRDDLLLDQVISEQTKADYISQGRDPAEAVQWLHNHEADVNRLFSLLRNARGRTETVYPGRLRMTLYGQLRYQLPVTAIEVVQEGRIWKLAVIY